MLDTNIPIVLWTKINYIGRMCNKHSQNASAMSPNIRNRRGLASEGFSPTDTVRCRAECAQTGSARREILQRCSRRGNKRERMRERGRGKTEVKAAAACSHGHRSLS